MRTSPAICLLLLAAALIPTGCMTIALKATDVISQEAAKADDKPDPNALDQAVGGAGRETQKGVQEVKKVEHEAIEDVKKVFTGNKDKGAQTE